MKRIFHLLTETDNIYLEWERLVLPHRVLGKIAYDARLVATMSVHQINRLLTFNVDDFQRYGEIEIIHPRDVSGASV